MHVTYHTDPASPRSWAGEPALRRVLTDFGDEVSVSYVTGGLARDIDDPLGMLRELLRPLAPRA